MTRRIFAVIGLVFCSAAMSDLSAQTPDKNGLKKTKMTTKLAKGTFEVKITPQAEDPDGEPMIGRLAMTKQFVGDLSGTSKGQMLGFQSTSVEGSGGYVAMERVTGTLGGLKGSFILQHIGTMKPGKYEMNISVVPDSGTEELKGISGKFKIIIEGEKHLYEFEYSIPKAL